MHANQEGPRINWNMARAGPILLVIGIIGYEYSAFIAIFLRRLYQIVKTMHS